MFEILQNNEIKNLLSQFNGYIVGGYVRDTILGKPSKDIDISSLYRPYEIEDKLIELKYWYKAHGKAYGVYVVTLSDGLEIELSAARRDLDCDGRHAKVEFIDNIVFDLGRRDLTINAMAIDVNGNLIDPYLGQVDLKNKIIKFVGDPVERIEEDNLRVWRAIRFAYKLGFNLEKNTEAAILQYINNFYLKPPFIENSLDNVRTEYFKNKSNFISKLSNERIKKEIEYIITFVNSNKLLWKLFTGLLQTTDLPIYRAYGLAQPRVYHDLDVYFHTHYAVFLSPPILEVRLAALLHDIGKPFTIDTNSDKPTFRKHDSAGSAIAELWMRKMTFPNEIVSDVVTLVLNHMYTIKNTNAAKLKFLYKKIGNEDLFRLYFLLKISDILAKKDIERLDFLIEHIRIAISTLTLQQEQPLKLAIDGFDVMKRYNIKPGKTVGNLLTIARESVFENPLNNNKEFLFELLDSVFIK